MKEKFAADAERIRKEMKNYQVKPSTVCIEPNDAVVKYIFQFGVNSYQKALNGKSYDVKQKSKTKKKGTVKSPIRIANADGYDDISPLDEFDRDVLGVIISEWKEGNKYTTVNIIYRALIGKIGDQNVRPQPNLKKAIEKSVLKLMSTIVDFSAVNDTLKNLKYADGDELKFKQSNLLAADTLDVKINGQVIEGVIFLHKMPPLLDIADKDNQIVRYNHELLDVPDQRNTKRIITLKKYVMRRICEIKLHKNLYPTITFDNVFKKCRMLDAKRDAKLDARNAIVQLFQHLKDQKFIKDFQLVKERGKFVSITFSF